MSRRNFLKDDLVRAIIYECGLLIHNHSVEPEGMHMHIRCRDNAEHVGYSGGISHNKVVNFNTIGVKYTPVWSRSPMWGLLDIWQDRCYQTLSLFAMDLGTHNITALEFEFPQHYYWQQRLFSDYDSFLNTSVFRKFLVDAFDKDFDKYILNMAEIAFDIRVLGVYRVTLKEPYEHILKPVTLRIESKCFDLEVT